ncbi:branched-chain amino acid ABC transporter permease [Bradyrhizobium diazoefficiens]|nr:branched-chain amino acid ABC transporter permease [Bradyrhizobium diazoefficiens]QQN66714.1 branched-chain amino acid ABC transporter permease [Bradyrhizobium diazoefficiens]
MEFAITTLLNVLAAIANLALISSGLAVIFGMMRVINLAHGEFIMLGGFATIYAARMGINIWIAIFVVSPLFVAAVGYVLERLVIRHLYGRLVDTMLATWGLSLALIGAATMIFGNRVEGVAAPLGGVSIGQYSISLYGQVEVWVVLVLFAAGYLVLKYTEVGLVARATMQNPAMAASLGVNPSRVYSFTFCVGAALSGLAGGFLAPLSGVVPTMGVAYVARAFITVITGGLSILVGTALSSSLLATIGTVATLFTTPVVGDVVLLVAAIVLLRLLPKGITGSIFRGAP